MADLLYTGVLEWSTGQQKSTVFAFSGEIPESTTVASHEVTVIRQDGVDVTSSRLVSSSQATTNVTVVLDTGTTEAGYLVQVDVTASGATPYRLTKLINVTPPGVLG